ncbi:MAG: amidophosphoribosyltransferase [Candidatus Omnitrophica bacterium]|nr:amidophosphoribosyltransferase [Candidatus Omnitrophota bacterium]MDD5593019.1 amidophosphoribosyltransferase [Candidatus Omnitrophota bacterium]
MCGIFGIYPHKDAAHLACLGLYALQHRGEESSGIITRNGKRVYLHKGLGLVSDSFGEKIIRTLRGEMAIGHVRYSTTGSSNIKNAQPFYVKSKIGDIAIAHNGNLTNTLELHKELENNGALFQTSMDSEIIAHLLAHSQKKDIKEAIIWSLSKLAGAYSLVLMLNDILIGARDTFGWRPLCLGKLDGAYVLASETCALDLIGAEYIRDIQPGEIVFIYKDNIESVMPFKKTPRAFCIFEYIYFARPDSNIFEHNVYVTRKRLGAQLAAEFPVEADLVMPIPDSGTYAALGFSEASKIPFEYGMIRNHYIGRTFIQPTQDLRDFRVKIKLNPLREVLNGKKVVIIEDSIVRGTTSRIRVRALRQAGAKEVHMRVSCPPLKFPCFYGIDFPTKKELVASRHDIAWVRDFIGADSLEYLSLEGMLSSMPLPKENFCTACFTGRYPINHTCHFSKNILER